MIVRASGSSLARRGLNIAAGVLVSTALVAALSGPVSAQDRNREFGYHGWGPRVGLSVNPDQVFFGAHLDMGEAFPHVRFQPNAELGFGDDATVFQLDGDLHYRFLEDWDVWNPYLGGGLGLAHISVDNGGSDTEFQVHMVGGIEKYIRSGKFFLETKLGIVDDEESPDWKFLAGWTFVAGL